jgi:hypothetical protein
MSLASRLTDRRRQAAAAGSTMKQASKGNARNSGVSAAMSQPHQQPVAVGQPQSAEQRQQQRREQDSSEWIRRRSAHRHAFKRQIGAGVSARM